MRPTYISGRGVTDAAWREELTAAAHGGTFAAAFGAWTREHVVCVMRKCQARMARRPAGGPAFTADDLHNEASRHAFEKLPGRLTGRGNPIRSVIGFVLTTCVDAAFEKLGGRRRSRAKDPHVVHVRYFDDGDAGVAEPVSPHDGPDAACERRELGELLWAAIDRLPRPLRVVLVMNHFEGMPLEEIARRVGVPVGTLKTRNVEAKRRLKDMLAGVVADADYAAVG